MSASLGPDAARVAESNGRAWLRLGPPGHAVLDQSGGVASVWFQLYDGVKSEGEVKLKFAKVAASPSSFHLVWARH